MSNAILAKNFRLEERSIKRILRRLCDIGALVKDEENGHRILRVNHDFFNIDGGDLHVTGVTSMSPGGDIQVSKGVTSMSPITHINTKKEHTPHTPQGAVADADVLVLELDCSNVTAKTAPKKPSPPCDPAPPSPKGEDDFEAFWEAYPKCDRKKGKANCKDIWLSRNLSKVKGKLMKALEIDKASRDWAKNGGEYIPFPKTWLNKKRYADIPDEEVKPVVSTEAKYAVLTNLQARNLEFHTQFLSWFDAWCADKSVPPPEWSVYPESWVKANRADIRTSQKL